MDPLARALHAASGGLPAAALAEDATASGGEASPGWLSPEPALVLGAGGHLGSALLAEALVAGRFSAVRAWVAAPLTSTLRGLTPLPSAELAGNGPLATATAFIVFERERFSHGRDEAFASPEPAQLVALAARLHQGGVRRLLVVLPHAASMLPQALAQGLANHDEVAVAALGFDHLVFIRPTQTLAAAPAAAWLQRFAQWWLSQLRWMVPEREQPLRAAVLARWVVALACRLPRAPRCTYVVPQSWLWLLAQGERAKRAESAASARAAGQGSARDSSGEGALTAPADVLIDTWFAQHGSTEARLDNPPT